MGDVGFYICALNLLWFECRAKRSLESAVICDIATLILDFVTLTSEFFQEKIKSCALNQFIWAFCCTLLDLIPTMLLLLSHFSYVQLFVTLLNVAHQAPLSMGFSRQEYWSGLPCSPPNLPDPGIKPTYLVSPELVGGFFTTGTPWKAQFQLHAVLIYPKVTTTFRSLCNSSL